MELGNWLWWILGYKWLQVEDPVKYSSREWPTIGLTPRRDPTHVNGRGRIACRLSAMRRSQNLLKSCVWAR